MNNTNTGGPAFPTPTHNLQNDGMTLRDYFAAKALTGMMASRNPNSPRFQPDHDAAYVYAVADAMLKARDQ
jgi:hypothetical protein